MRAAAALLVGLTTAAAQQATNVSCSFSLQQSGLVDSCNWSLASVAQYGVRAWQLGIGLNSAWLGGPPRQHLPQPRTAKRDFRLDFTLAAQCGNP